MELTVSNKTVIRVLAMITAFIVGIWLVIHLQRELFWIATAFFLAVTFDPAVAWVQRRMPKRSRAGAIAAVFVSIGLVLVGIGSILIPPLVTQAKTLVVQAPHIVDNLQSQDSTVARAVSQYDLTQELKKEQDKIVSSVEKASGSFVGIAQGLFSNLISTVFILTMTFFMLIEGPVWIDMLVKRQPKAKQPEYRELIKKLYHATRSYTIGNLLRGLIAAIVSLIPLLILHVPYALPLAIMLGVLNLIPLIGASIGGVIIVIVCLFVSIPVAIFMVLYLIVYQQIENNVIQPFIFGRSLELSALVVLIAALIGASLAGLLGAFAAIPIAASIRILIAHNQKYPRVPAKTAKATK